MWPLLDISDLDVVNSANVHTRLWSVPQAFVFRPSRQFICSAVPVPAANSSAASAKLPGWDLPKQVLPRVDLSRKRAFQRGHRRGAERDRAQPYSPAGPPCPLSCSTEKLAGFVELRSVGSRAACAARRRRSLRARLRRSLHERMAGT